MNIIGNDLKLSNNTYPLTLNGTNCINISNGISKFIVTNSGEFLNNCIINTDYSQFQITVLPNPFIDFVYVTFKNNIISDNKFRLTIYQNDGTKLKTYYTTQDLLQYSYKLNLNDLIGGIYYLEISSEKVHKIFKILKHE
jgi:hypothetical protein